MASYDDQNRPDIFDRDSKNPDDLPESPLAAGPRKAPNVVV